MYTTLFWDIQLSKVKFLNHDIECQFSTIRGHLVQRCKFNTRQQSHVLPVSTNAPYFKFLSQQYPLLSVSVTRSSQFVLTITAKLPLNNCWVSCHKHVSFRRYINNDSWCSESYSSANRGRRCIVRKLNVAITFAEAYHLFYAPYPRYPLRHAGVSMRSNWLRA